MPHSELQEDAVKKARETKALKLHSSWKREMLECCRWRGKENKGDHEACDPRRKG